MAAHLQDNVLSLAVIHELLSLEVRRQLYLIDSRDYCGCFHELLEMPDPEIGDSNTPQKTL